MSETKTGLAADGQEVRDPQTAQRHYQDGLKAEQRSDRWKAIEEYEAGFAADPDDPSICFRLAYNLDLVGEEDEALHLYEQVSQHPGVPLNALMNLAILYEDRGQYAAAERCLKQVLDTNANHARARLYIKDVMASKAMVVEDSTDKHLEKHQAIMDTPVTDFELSVRTRNALRKMNIRTLADLLRTTEAELRSFKNFGDASIEEIKAMLAQRGLRLGIAAEQQQSAAKQAVYEQLKSQTGGDETMLSRTVSELNLSVRARKALALLNIQSIGELCLRTEAELMGVKNFGITSLLEIKTKLAEMGLTLRTLEG